MKGLRIAAPKSSKQVDIKTKKEVTVWHPLTENDLKKGNANLVNVISFVINNTGLPYATFLFDDGSFNVAPLNLIRYVDSDKATKPSKSKKAK